MLFRSPTVRYAFLVCATTALVLGGGILVVDAGTSDPDPVAFSETTDLGLTAQQETIRQNESIRMPRVQVFYSQYQYVVGYHGVEQAVTRFQQPTHERQFGYPTAVYVTGYDETGVTLTDSSRLHVSSDPAWVDATDAHFVVGSDARSATGETVVPFADAERAREFTARHGGHVHDWERVQSLSFDLQSGSSIRADLPDRHRRADRRVENVQSYSERPVSTVVGEDAPTVQATIDAAPPNTTVLVPSGTYEETVEITKPLTLRGQNATLRGDGNGTVVSVSADAVEISGFDIAGVGDTLQGESLDSGSGWDSRIQSGYGTGDAGIAGNGSANLSVSDVRIETPANGVLLRSSPGTVVENVTVNGTEKWAEGFMGVMAMNSPVVVQHSTFRGGRDGIYLHRSHGTVIRANTFRENRFGVHLMYTSESLVANNVATGQGHAGVTIMTAPTRNAIVGNWIRNASTGILPAGSRSYIAENVIAYNDRGITTSASQSVYTRNLLYENDVGIQSGYGTGDAGIAGNGSEDLSVSDVRIETPANGVLLRSSPGTVVENVTVNGTEKWAEGFMGVMAMNSPVVVQHSTFRGGRDGIYLHRSHGTVIRANTFRENRFGVHLMYTSESLVANNVATGQGHAGVTIMTAPTRNAIVGNWIRNASTGILPAGSRSYIAENVIAYNDRGITTSASQSVYTRNLLYENDIGVQSGSIRPSNLVFDNDFVDNDEHAEAGIGPLRIWTYEGTGNYWSGVSASASHLDQSYSPTDILQSRLHRTDGVLTLTQSPVMRALNAVRDQSPGIRQGEIVDTAPRAQPHHEHVIATLDRGVWPPATTQPDSTDD
jgi:parallel beta-helix repeat protein